MHQHFNFRESCLSCGARPQRRIYNIISEILILANDGLYHYKFLTLPALTLARFQALSDPFPTTINILEAHLNSTLLIIMLLSQFFMCFHHDSCMKSRNLDKNPRGNTRSDVGLYLFVSGFHSTTRQFFDARPTCNQYVPKTRE